MNLKKTDKNLYDRIHNWAKKNVVKPEECNRCKEIKPLELSNNSRMYIAHPEDWEWICHLCHARKDRWSLGRKLTQEHKRKIGLANSIALIGITPWNKGLKTASIEVICECCQRRFFVGKWKYEHGRGRFCSQICRKRFYQPTMI